MELAFSMPGHLKMRDGEQKCVLKRAMKGVLPERILTRKKEGFSVPVKNWLRGPLQPLMRSLLSGDRVRRRGFFEPARAARMMDEHVAGRANHAHTLFPLMVFERWCEEHVR
jgi:asparagine synthase (glutamine-hydrolysing)